MSNLGKFMEIPQPPGMIGAQKMGILKIHKSAGSWMLGPQTESTRLYQLYIIIALINTLTLYLKDRA